MTDWHKLSHAYGKATDTPGLLNQLRGADWQQATNDLYASILHQGTIYTATLPAIAELTAIVLDLTAPGRVGAANLIADYADSVKVGWAHNPNYLPKKLNLDEFEASACAALGEAVAALTPCLADGDSDIRQCVALTCERTVNLPSVTIDALHKRLADETVASVITALVAAIQAHGGLTDAETANLQHAAPEVRFAQAATALVNGLLGDDTIATAAELWSNCVANFEANMAAQSLIEDVVAANRLAVLPLLTQLAQQSGRALHDAIDGYYCLRWYRGSTAPAVCGLLDMCDRAGDIAGFDDELPGGDTLRNRLIYALAEFAPALHAPAPAGVADTEDVVHFCDALWRLVTTSDRPVFTSTLSWLPDTVPNRRDIRADAIDPLLRLADARWFELLSAVLDEAGGQRVMCHEFNSAVSLSFTISRRLAAQPCPPELVPGLVALIDRELRRGGTNWLDVIAACPNDATAPLTDAVCDLLATAPLTIDVRGNSRDNPLLRQCAPLLAAWQANAAVPRLRELALADWAQAPWAALALQAITGQGGVDESVRQHGVPEYSGKEFLDLWATTQTPGLIDAALAAVGDKASTSYPGRHGQLAAARIAARAGCGSQVWPTVLDIVTAQDDPLPDAVATAIEIAGDDQTQCSQLAELLQSIAVSPKKSRWGSNQPAPVTAWCGLDALGVDIGDAAAKAALKMLNVMTRDASQNTLQAIPGACSLLIKVAESDAKQGRIIVKKLRSIIDADNRLPIRTDVVGTDCEVVAALQQALGAMLN